MRAKLDETLYCSYTYSKNSDIPCDVHLVLTFGSGLLTRRAIMGSTDKPAEGTEKENGDCEHEPAAKKSKQDVDELYVSALTDEELEPLRSSLWFHDLQEGGQSQGPDAWDTRWEN